MSADRMVALGGVLIGIAVGLVLGTWLPSFGLRLVMASTIGLMGTIVFLVGHSRGGGIRS